MRRNWKAAAMGVIVAGAQLTAPVWAEENKKTLENTKALVEADNRIGAELTQKLAAQKENVLVSSYSVASALALLYHCGEDAPQIDELGSFLGFDGMTKEQVLEAQKQLARTLGVADAQSEDANEGEAEENDDEFGLPKIVLETANAMYIDDKVETVPSYEELTKLLFDTYQASAKQCDLSGEETKQEINGWVAEKTHGLIDSILDEPMSEDVRMMLLNALYFQASWVDPFLEENTDQQTFHGTERDTTVDMMHKQRYFRYSEDDTYQIICIPYYGGCEMTVYLPKDIETVEKWSEEGYIRQLGSEEREWESREVALSMPKFELECSRELSDVLETMGIEKIFEENVYDSVADELLTVSSILHKTVIKNDENGTEAAAVTAMFVAMSALTEPEEVVEMNIDHPFYFTISNEETGLKLFEGCVFNQE